MISTAQFPRLVVLATLGLTACASQGVDLASGPMSPVAAPVVETASTSAQAAETVSRLPSPSAYQLTKDEQELSCKKLTGRMAVRIVQIRDFQTRNQASPLARSLQAATKPMFGGSGEGSDPDGRHARDIAILRAYNQRLAEKKCPDFDLEKELAPGATELPRTRPVQKP
jgi:hypothetical protein